MHPIQRVGQPTHPRRPMGFTSAWALGVGTMVGAGIFSLSADAARYAGPGAILSYVIAGAGALVLAVNFGYLATIHPVSGGPYVYIRDTLGSTAAFVAGWQLWVGMGLSTSFYCLGFARYLTYFVTAPEYLTAPACVLAVAAVNAMGPRVASALQNLSVAILLIVMGGFMLTGVLRVDPAFYAPLLPYGWPGVLDAVPLVFTSYLGFEMVAQAAGAIQDPRRTVPRAMVASVLAVTALYAGVMAVSVGVVHHVDLATSPTPLAEVARRLAGRGGAAAVALGGLVATLSSANGSMLASLELGGAMWADGLLPRWLTGGSSGAGRAVGWRPSSVRLGMVAIAVAIAGTWVGRLDWLARGVGVLHFLPFSVVPLALLHVLGAPEAARTRPSEAWAARAWAVSATAVMGLLLRRIDPLDLWVAATLTLPGVLWLWRRR
ncbi:APC family permease [Geochorda subterranea]|uniref:APC family permease n=1 Tax=Geochorda subterranea TaxID=3109564 RepID=A0ABZ1BPF1_9FIRM|nr:APC family permease [Limnochorda sp. LNt]WRP14687.1 APC family permease [Limnochorda sp. LNt]